VNNLEVLDCPQFLEKKQESELPRSLGVPQFLAKKMESELSRS